MLSSCNTEKSGKQQVVQILPNLDELHGLIIISKSSLLNQSLCVPINNQTEYVLSIPVGNTFNIEVKDPLGRQLISNVIYAGKNLY